MINILKNLPFFQKNNVVKVPVSQPLSAFERIKELLAPPGAEFGTDYFQIGNIYGRSLVILDYPVFLFSGWLEKIINIDEVFNLSIYIYPLETAAVLKQLEKQLAKVAAQIYEREKSGKVRSPELETAYKNVEQLRDFLVQAQEKMLQIGLYITIFAQEKKELDMKTTKIIKALESSLISVKPVLFLQKESFITNTPINLDQMNTNYYLNSSTTSSFFPFVSSELVEKSGVFLGINIQNAGLVILDRFNYENPHMVILARSGSGKSYTAKLEVMRNLMMGTDVIVLDPENEYQSIAELYNGSFVNISLRSENKFNPFDIPPVLENENAVDVYKEHVADLLELIQLLIGEKLSSEDLSILDRAINQTYESFNILPDQDFSQVKTFPTLNDLEKILFATSGGEKIASKLYPFTQGNFSGFINEQTTTELNKRLNVFGFKELPDILRPIGMFVVLKYVFNKIKKELKKRVVVIDEAWWIMRQEFGAEFLLNIIKRGRKYGVGVTSITQDTEDFLTSPYGRPILTNSALVLLLKQSSVSIDILGKIYALTEGEKNFLLTAERGYGLLIAGKRRIPIYILASYAEDQIIKTRPEQFIALKKAKGLK